MVPVPMRTAVQVLICNRNSIVGTVLVVIFVGFYIAGCLLAHVSVICAVVAWRLCSPAHGFPKLFLTLKFTNVHLSDTPVQFK